MQELTDDEQATLRKQIAALDYESALASLVDWSQMPDAALPAGKTHARLESWAQNKTGSTSKTSPPTADSLTTLLPASSSTWHCVDLLTALEQLLLSKQRRSTHLHHATSSSGNKYWFVPKLAWPHGTRNDRMPYGLANHLTRLRVVPAELPQPNGIPFGVQLTELSARDAAAFRAHARGDLSGFLVHLETGVQLEMQNVGSRWYATGFSQNDAAPTTILERTQEASGCTFLVIPECTVPPDLRGAIAQTLAQMKTPAPLLTVAGSFHELESGDLLPVNAAYVLDARGNELIRHCKTFPAALPGGHAEGIRTHNELHALATPIGLIAVAICAEFSHASQAANAFWSALAPDWMLVPSMGEESTLELHLATASALQGTHKTTTLVANQPPTGTGFPGFVVDGGSQRRGQSRADYPNDRRQPQVNRRIPLSGKPELL